MLQAEFVTDLFKAVKHLAQETHHPLTCLIDSNGTVPFARYPELMKHCDGVMLDIKAWDNEAYHALTHASDNKVVKENFVWLLQNRKLTEVRIVCVPGRVDVENILRNIAETFDFIGRNVPVRLLRFRPHGVIGELADASMPTDEQMEAYLSSAQALGVRAEVR